MPWKIYFKNPLQERLVEAPIFEGVLSEQEEFGEWEEDFARVGAAWGPFVVTDGRWVASEQKWVRFEPMLNFINDLTRRGWVILFHNHLSGEVHLLDLMEKAREDAADG